MPDLRDVTDTQLPMNSYSPEPRRGQDAQGYFMALYSSVIYTEPRLSSALINLAEHPRSTSYLAWAPSRTPAAPQRAPAPGGECERPGGGRGGAAGPAGAGGGAEPFAGLNAGSGPGGSPGGVPRGWAGLGSSISRARCLRPGAALMRNKLRHILSVISSSVSKIYGKIMAWAPPAGPGPPRSAAARRSRRWGDGPGAGSSPRRRRHRRSPPRCRAGGARGGAHRAGGALGAGSVQLTEPRGRAAPGVGTGGAGEGAGTKGDVQVAGRRGAVPCSAQWRAGERALTFPSLCRQKKAFFPSKDRQNVLSPARKRASAPISPGREGRSRLAGGSRLPRCPPCSEGRGEECRIGPAVMSSCPSAPCAPGDASQLCFCCSWHLNNQTGISSLSERRQIPLRAVSGLCRIGRAGDLFLFKSVSPTSEPREDRLWSLVKCSKNYRPINWLAWQGRKQNGERPAGEVLQPCSGWSRFRSPFCPGSSGTLSKIILVQELSGFWYCRVCEHKRRLRIIRNYHSYGIEGKTIKLDCCLAVIWIGPCLEGRGKEVPDRLGLDPGEGDAVPELPSLRPLLSDGHRGSDAGARFSGRGVI